MSAFGPVPTGKKMRLWSFGGQYIQVEGPGPLGVGPPPRGRLPDLRCTGPPPSTGARGRDVLSQFLVESVVLCIQGGLGGILVGVLATEAIANYAGWPAYFSTEAMIVAVSVSAGVGIFFGFYPAWKASRLDPIVALRQE